MPSEGLLPPHPWFIMYAVYYILLKTHQRHSKFFLIFETKHSMASQGLQLKYAF